MQCQEFEAVLEQTSDLPLSAEAAAHVAECPQCQGLTADLNKIMLAARELREAEQEPPARVWASLRLQLEIEGIIHAPVIVTPSAEPWAGWISGVVAWMHQPALVASYAAFMVLAAGLAWEQSTPEMETQPQPPSAATLQTRNSLNTLEAQTQTDLQSMDPEVNAAVQRDLKIVNNFIAVCEKAVRDEPQNDAARQYLYGAYQQKAELLTAAMDHTRTGE
jgi:hypothetical protein